MLIHDAWYKQRGEIILVILLVMAVGLTIGLSVAGRSLTDMRLSTQIEESSRAFSAAEAGIEEALKAGIISSTTEYHGVITDTDTKYDVTLSSLGGSGGQFAFPNNILEGDAQTIWLVPHDEDGPVITSPSYTANTITVCWSKVTATKPAIEVSLFYKAADGTYKVTREGFDPDKASRSDNEFTDSGITTPSSSCQNGSNPYLYEVNLNFTTMPAPAVTNPTSDILIALRLRPVYADSKIAVVPASGNSIPEQGKNISSVGQTDTGVTRKWNVVQTYAASQDIFDYSMWSNTNINKSL